ncbi:hypothetical protein FQA39_LY01599 [Lamprigera yunnana]|nr:hypothetical protein FQA39_LY01599 [Lamprigera yunnana]
MNVPVMKKKYLHLAAVSVSQQPSSTSDENEVVGETHQFSTASVSPELSDTSTTQDNYEDDTDTSSEEAEEETESADNHNDWLKKRAGKAADVLIEDQANKQDRVNKQDQAGAQTNQNK